VDTQEVSLLLQQFLWGFRVINHLADSEISIRSASVLFLPDKSQDGGPSKSGRKDFLNPVLCGFGRSRPEQRPEQRPKQRAAPKPGQTVESGNIELDIYQHPDKRDRHSLTYTRGCDIYS